jgi:transcription termination factor Rho
MSSNKVNINYIPKLQYKRLLITYSLNLRKNIPKKKLIILLIDERVPEIDYHIIKSSFYIN